MNSYGHFHWRLLQAIYHHTLGTSSAIRMYRKEATVSNFIARRKFTFIQKSKMSKNVQTDNMLTNYVKKRK